MSYSYIAAIIEIIAMDFHNLWTLKTARYKCRWGGLWGRGRGWLRGAMEGIVWGEEWEWWEVEDMGVKKEFWTNSPFFVVFTVFAVQRLRRLFRNWGQKMEEPCSHDWCATSAQPITAKEFSYGRPVLLNHSNSIPHKYTFCSHSSHSKF